LLAHLARRYGNAVLREQLFGLEFVNVHGAPVDQERSFIGIYRLRVGPV
jgi:hypothetical protein